MKTYVVLVKCEIVKEFLIPADSAEEAKETAIDMFTPDEEDGTHDVYIFSVEPKN